MKNSIVFFFLILLFHLSCSEKKSIDTKVTPNIILFLVDDLGWQDTSLPFWKERTENNKKYFTPSMEKLADEGMKFTQAYACSVCSPTRVSLLSGMNTARHRVSNWTLHQNKNSVMDPEGLITPEWNLNGAQVCDSIERSVQVTPLPQILKDHGYYTIHCGKAHFAAIGTPGANPLHFGFDKNIAGHAAGAPGSYQGEDNFSSSKNGKGNIWDVPGLEKYHGTNINLNAALTKEAILAMEKASSLEKPFYLYMSHYGVHTPIQADKRFYQKYLDLGYDEIEAKYASMVESVDKSLGDIMTYLAEKRIEDNTIILFMSDNGGLSAVARGGKAHTHNFPLSSGKGSAHEGGIREPMIVKWPGMVNGQTKSDEYVIVEDFFPSILEMAGIENYQTIQKVDGISFVPILKDKKTDKEIRSLFWHYPNHWGPSGPGIGASSSIRHGDWKLIYYHIDESFELFNLASDISEQYNLAYSNKQKSIELANKLTDFLISVDAQMPTLKSTSLKVKWPSESANEIP